MKFPEYLAELFFWLQIFICPVLILGFAGYLIYYNYKGAAGIGSFFSCTVLGVVLGVFFAEKIRRTVGCAKFMTKR